MNYRLRHVDLDDKMCQRVQLEILDQVYPYEQVCACLDKHHAWEQRERRLTMRLILHVLIASCLWTRDAMPRVVERLARPLHLLGLSLAAMQVTAAAICYRRRQLGSAPLRTLFEQCCHPMCTPDTPGAYRGGLHVMLLDGTMQNSADTPANAQAFARPSSQSGPGAFPQARVVVLCEAGSHAIVDARIGDHHQAEVSMAHQMLDSLTPGMLLLHDALFTGLRFWSAVRQRGAHVLAPLPARHLGETNGRRLEDGSGLTQYAPYWKLRQEGIEPLEVRIIEYEITDERLGEKGRRYRLATTLLDPVTAPALDLIEWYHERWEVETTIDEIKTHQRSQQAVLRSRTPEGVRQELYALFMAHSTVRWMMHQAACEAGVDPDRLSFTDGMFEIGQTTYE